MNRPRIVVIGSLNMDIVFECEQLASPGQTVLAERTSQLPGGKGANQAVAAAKAGGIVSMIGRVGEDAFGRQLVSNLTLYDINTDHVMLTADHSSGTAAVMVDANGQNSIVVSAGANAQLTPDDLDAARHIIDQADILLLQLEIPLVTVEYAIELAHHLQIPVMLDPAPVTAEALKYKLFDVDLICPNQTETETLTGVPSGTKETAAIAASELVRLGAKTCLVTMSDKGTIIHDGTTSRFLESHQVNAIDSTAAGDAFAGAFAVRFTETKCLTLATHFASAAGALSATKRGAQPSMPTREDILAMSELKK